MQGCHCIQSASTALLGGIFKVAEAFHPGANKIENWIEYWIPRVNWMNPVYIPVWNIVYGLDMIDINPRGNGCLSDPVVEHLCVYSLWLLGEWLE